MISALDVTCTSCKETYWISSAVKDTIVSEGTLRRGEMPAGDGAMYGVWVWLGICVDCQAALKYKLDKPRFIGPVEHEAALYQRLIRMQRLEHPNWPLKKCVEAAGKEIHDPHREPDSRFRAYLLGPMENQVSSVEVSEVHRLLEPKDVTVAVFQPKPKPPPFDAV